jgi:putative polyhydroxyalkanoate system protein
MADIDVRRVHDLGLKAARIAADRMAGELGRKFDLRGDWEGNVLHFERPGVTGTLAITAKDLHLSVTLGFLLRALKGSIERAVHEQLDALFPITTRSPRGQPPSKKAPARPKKGA